jgi:RsiW-degrading membrane proteinase PrsW (M82 family)
MSEPAGSITYPDTRLPQPGWFADPHDPSQLRWWSGREWTRYVYRLQAQPTATVVVPKPKPPRKWLGRRGGLIIGAAFAAIWVYLLLISLAFAPFVPPTNDPAAHLLSPFLLLTGSAGVATAFLYTMAYRLRPEDRLSVPFLLIAAVVGGALAALLAAPINLLISLTTGGTDVGPSVVALGLAGVVEEFAKILAVVVVAWKLPIKNVRNGLFVGGAVGFGFSAIENMSYLNLAWTTGLAHNNPVGLLLTTTLLRQLTGPFLHPMFTALLAAAVFGASRNGRFRLTFGVFGAYLAVAAAHGLYDSSFNLARLVAGSTLGADALALLMIMMLIAATTLVWWRVSKRAHAVAFGLVPNG